ncbi:hypothetical protein ASPCADRAFT_176225 [Aspergillus carbonarius ITEM 5010]|uniref:DRBM domain-containing protein n=1 Tax=Aspergillus carbonarius (strain ITEM 5010) TaxID=602072 RepID=A0A1R3RB68_ASPC5|nr:hypothetical protein ASPCADRAFT_176225 [Aspergillus carbonarius ITEM 5010]
MSPSFAQSDCYTETDYEIGKRLFDVNLVLKFVQSSPDGRTYESVAQADHFINSKAFNFDQALADIKDSDLDVPRREPIGDETDETCIYKIVGYVRLCSAKWFVRLMTILSLRIPSGSNHTSRSPTIYPESFSEEPAAHHISPVPTQQPSNPNDDQTAWKYTSLLWEEAQIRGDKPVVKEICLSNYPSLFRVTISYMGTQASGEGRSKRLARHIAAKGVCQTLGLQPC